MASIYTLFDDIATAIKEKTTLTSVTPDDMPDAIRSISGNDFIEVEWSDYVNSAIDLGVNIDNTYTVECLFYANTYVNDGHIIGSMTSSGDPFHLTTYSNRWYASIGTSEFNFSADSTNYPLSGSNIKYRVDTSGQLYLNDILCATSTRGTYGTRFALNTRGGGVSTTGRYKYSYFKIWDSNNELIHHFVFGTVFNGSVKVCHDKITDAFILYT